MCLCKKQLENIVAQFVQQMALAAVGKSRTITKATWEGSLPNILLVFIKLLLLFITYQASIW